MTLMDSAVKKAERQINSKGRLEIGMALVKNDVPPRLMPAIVGQLLANPRWSTFINPDPFPKELRVLKDKTHMGANSFKRDALWLAASLKPYRVQLSQFLTAKKAFETSVLESDWSLAGKILDEIREQFGQSLWYVENKILLISQLEGTEAQQSFTSVIIADTDIDFLSRLVIYFFSRRAEPNISIQKLTDMAEEFLRSTHIGYGEKAYVNLHVMPFQERTVAEIDEACASEFNSPIIDKYLFLETLLRQIFSFTGLQELRIHAKLIVMELVGINPSGLIRNLHYLLLDDAAPPFEPEAVPIVRAIDHYTRGEYSSAKTAFEKILKGNPNLVEIYEAKVRSEEYLGIKNLQNLDDRILYRKMQSLMRQVLLKTENFDLASETLLKFTMIYASHGWTPQILSFVKGNGQKSWVEDIAAHSIQAGLSAPLSNPRQFEAFDAVRKGKSFLGQLLESIPDSPTIKLLLLLYDSTEEAQQQLVLLPIPEERKNRFLCIQHILSKRYSEAIEPLLRTSVQPLNDAIYFEAVSYLSICYLRLGKIGECIDVIVNAYLKKTLSFVVLPITEVISRVHAERIKSVQEKISWPILVEINYRHFPDVSEDDRSDAYQDFMEANHFKFPSEVARQHANFKGTELLFFLKNICVPSVIDTNVVFKKSEDVGLERINICRFLGGLDKANEQEYMAELKAITESMTIKKLSRQIEQSKIYVDTESIKIKLERWMEESYNRYIYLLKNPKLDGLTVDFFDKIMRHMQRTGRLAFTTPFPTEGAFIIHKLIDEIQNQFTYASDSSLDFNISTRIRHGTLSGQIRGVLATYNLVSIKEDNSDNYKNNLYWEENLNDLPPDVQKNVQRFLKEFSFSIDAAINKVNSEWLQIRKSSRDKGLFDYYSNAEIYYRFIIMRIKSNTTYDEFLDITFSVLWDVTRINLLAIQKRLEDEFVPQIVGLLTKLREDLQTQFYLFSDNGLIREITNATTEIQNSLDRVVEWFQVSKSKEIPNFEITTAIAVGLDAINSYFPTHKLIPEIDQQGDIDQVQIQGKYLTAFSDIFLILFQNVKKHSAIVDHPPQLKIYISKEGKEICLRFKNELSHVLDVSSILEKTGVILRSTAQRSTDYQVQKEGGSGLLKLAKIFEATLKCLPALRVAVEPGWFEIEVKFNAEHIVA